MPGLQMQFDNVNIDRLKQQFNRFIEDLNKNGQIDLKLNTALIKEDLMKTTSDIDKVVEKYKQLGTVQDVKQNFDNNGNLDSFIIKLERTKGLLETIRYDSMQSGSLSTVNGDPQATQFGVTNITQTDNRIKLAQKMAEAEVKAEDDIQNAIAKTISEREKLNLLDEGKQANASNKNLEEQVQSEEAIQNAIAKTIEKREQENQLSEQNQTNASNKALEQEYQDRQKIQEAIANTIAKREEEKRVLEETQAKTSNKALEDDYNAQQEFDQKISASQASRRNEELKAEEAQAKAINKIKEQEYQTQLDEQARIQKLGEVKGTFSGDLLTKSSTEIKNLAKDMYDADAKVTSFSKSLDGAGNSVVKMTVETKNSRNEIEQEKIVFDQATQSIYKNEEALKTNTMSMGGFGDRLKNAFVAIASFATVTAGFYAVIQQIQQGISLVNDMNKAQTNIQMITGMNSTQVQTLTKDYSNLAGQLHETTDQVMAASEEFLRAGNSAEDTSKLLQASTVMSKIAGQSQADSAQSLISIQNAYKLSASDMISVVDKMVAVDNTSATSTAELSAAIQKVASSASNVGVTLPQLRKIGVLIRNN